MENDALFDLYDDYDACKDRKQRKAILEQILQLDPDDVDSMHRLIDYLPKKSQMEALLELKEKAVKIVQNNVDDLEDIYLDHHLGRALLYLMYDLLGRHERLGQIEEAYQLTQEMMRYNEGDNLGERFHLVAYYIGQDKLDELYAFIKDCPDDYSPALRFADLYLTQIAKDDNFQVLFDEFPYLYAFLSKEIPWSKQALETKVQQISMYRPGGFLDCLEFYYLLQVYSTKEVKKKLFNLCAYSRDLPKLSLLESFPKEFKPILYGMVEVYQNHMDQLEAYAAREGIDKAKFKQMTKSMAEFGLIEVSQSKGKDIFYFGEATVEVLKIFAAQDYDRAMRAFSALYRY